MITISKTFDFDAAHFLPLVPNGHKCKRMHGHTYRVEVLCSGPLDAAGMVVDYGAIALVWQAIHGLLDHRVLNEVPGLENPTTEVLAPFIFKLFAESSAGVLPVVAVKVYESSSTWCEYRP